jgi:hypothetical protein
MMQRGLTALAERVTAVVVAATWSSPRPGRRPTPPVPTIEVDLGLNA